MTRRLASIDALRGVALLLMVIDHSFDWWLAEPYREAERLTEFLGSLAAPIFVALVGVGLALAVGKQQQRSVAFGQVLRTNVQRGLFFIAMAYVLNFVVFFVGNNWADVFALDVLHLIGLGIIGGVFLVWYLGAIPLLALSVAWAVFSALVGGDIVLPGWLGTWLNNQPGINYFPLLPWLAYVWLGLGIGKLALRVDGRVILNSGWLLLVAAGWLGLMLVAPNVGYRHPHLPFMCFSLSVMFLIWALLQRLDTAHKVTSRWLVGPLALMGQAAFMLYFFHHLVGHRFLYHLGLVTGRSWQGNYGALNPSQALVGLIGMVVLCYAVSAPWLKIRKNYQASKRQFDWATLHVRVTE